MTKIADTIRAAVAGVPDPVEVVPPHEKVASLAEPTAEAALAAEHRPALKQDHYRISIPLNLSVWKDRTSEEQELLLWFHQHCLDEDYSLAQAAEAINYDKTTAHRVLMGTYQGSWKNVCDRIVSYKGLFEKRVHVRQTTFSENPISKLIFSALDYAMANNSITVIEGESRSGKSFAGREWARRNNHGRSCFVEAPVFGGTAELMRSIASKSGISASLRIYELARRIAKAFNRNRIVLIDEAHRLIPARSEPIGLEWLRSLHDQTGCAVALFVTKRFRAALEKGPYQFEQLLGRIGMPVRLPEKFDEKVCLPIIEQFLQPNTETLERLVDIANRPGRLGVMVETLKVSERIAKKASRPLMDEHVAKAIAARKKMGGAL